jgi:HEAT repeat protein
MGPAINEIILALSSSDESERCYAVEDLQEVKDPNIIPHLIMALQDRSVRVRETAVDVLTNVGGGVTAEAVASLLSSEHVPARNAAIEILEKLGQPALYALEKYINSSSVDIRKFSIDIIGKVLAQTHEAHPLIFEALVDRLSDEDVNVAGAAAEALGLTKDDGAIPYLLINIFGANQSSWLQCNIIAALSRISSEQSLEALQQIDKAKLFEEAQTYLEMALDGEVL